jgi:hypothetical protein
MAAPETSPLQPLLMARGSPVVLAAVFGAVGVLVHVLTNGRYGYFRDELYYLDCGRHLDWGYVDQPPLIALLARSSVALLGDSLQAIRLLPALAAGAELFLTGLIAVALGAKRTAVMLACLPVLFAPGFLVAESRLTMNAFEPLFWMGSAYVLILALRDENPRLLLWAGVLLGLGLENKHSMLFYGCALAVGLLLTPQRSLYHSGWLWAAVGLATAFFLPNLLWQAQRGWPTLEFLANVKRSQGDVEIAPVAFLWQQVRMLQPIASVVWVPGLWLLLSAPSVRRFRFLGWAYLLVLAWTVVLKGKDYYVLPAYPALFAAGGVFWEAFLEVRPRWRWSAAVYVVAVGVLGLARAPFAVPILSAPSFFRYQQALGILPRNADPRQTGQLPQHFGDEFGWEEMVRAVADVYRSLPLAERERTAILAKNYGEAGAIDFFGPRYGLPAAISGHQNYFFWGPGNRAGLLLILLQWTPEEATAMCERVEDGPLIDVPFSMQEEHYRILLCRQTREPLQKLWPRLKRWR